MCASEVFGCKRETSKSVGSAGLGQALSCHGLLVSQCLIIVNPVLEFEESVLA